MLKKTTIGGQALLEGLMMVGPERIAMAVRKPDGEIFVEDWSVGRLSKAATIPFVRGSVRLFRQLVTGTKALMRSAEFIEDVPEVPVEGAPVKEPKKPGRLDRFFEKHTDVLIYGSVLVGLLFSVGLFILLPNFLVTVIGPLAALKNSRRTSTWCRSSTTRRRSSKPFSNTTRKEVSRRCRPNAKTCSISETMPESAKILP